MTTSSRRSSPYSGRLTLEPDCHASCTASVNSMYFTPSVKFVAVVRSLEGVSDLESELQGLFNRNRPVLDAVLQGRTFH